MDEKLAIEPGAWYRITEVVSSKGRRGRLPVGRTWLYEQIAAGRLKTRKLGPRATVVAGADLLELIGGAQ